MLCTSLCVQVYVVASSREYMALSYVAALAFLSEEVWAPMCHTM